MDPEDQKLFLIVPKILLEKAFLTNCFENSLVSAMPMLVARTWEQLKCDYVAIIREMKVFVNKESQKNVSLKELNVCKGSETISRYIQIRYLCAHLDRDSVMRIGAQHSKGML